MADRAKEDKALTPEDFVVRWPLYTPFSLDDFHLPDRVSVDCEECGKETTWVRAQSDMCGLRGPGEDFFWAQYTCNLCTEQYLLIIYKEIDTELRRLEGTPAITRVIGGPPSPHEVRVVTKVKKIGQSPPLSINIPKALEKNLGKEATLLYKKALINRNEGNGLAAVTYIRRVVEDKTDDLIEVVAKSAEAHGVEGEIVQKIRGTLTQRTTYDQKLKLAATVLPASIVPDGANPLSVLYGLVSEGVHDLSEERCIAVTDETRSVFEFTFTHLRAETEARKDFVAKVKKLAGGKGSLEKG